MSTLKLLLAGCLVMAGMAITQAQTADEIVSKYVTAIGGLDNWKKITSIKMDGSFSVQGNDVTITITKEAGKGMRQDISVAGQSGYIIVTPTAGTSFLPFQGQTDPQAMPAEAVKQAQDAMDVSGPLVDYKAKGHSVELQGKETIDGVECYKLKVTLNTGKVITAYIDSKNYYLVRTIAKQSLSGQEVEQTTSFSNFQKLPEGIYVPMTITQQFGDITINKVSVNQPVDPTLFKTN